jgi:hypothetical protein
MSVRIRQRLFVDVNVQGAIARRLGLYFVSAIVFMVLPSAVARTFQAPERLFFTHLHDVAVEYGPLLLTLLAMAPFVFYDALKLTHRFAGPVFRLRRQLARFDNGEPIVRLEFRDGDFWQDLAVLANALLERVRLAENRAASSQPGETDLCQADGVAEQNR